MVYGLRFRIWGLGYPQCGAVGETTPANAVDVAHLAPRPNSILNSNLILALNLTLDSNKHYVQIRISCLIEISNLIQKSNLIQTLNLIKY